MYDFDTDIEDTNEDLTDIRFWIGLAEEDLHHNGLEEFGYPADTYDLPGDATVDLAYRLKAGYEAGVVIYATDDFAYNVEDLPAPWGNLAEQERGF